MTKKSFLPDDLRDFLSIISFIGFIAIFFEFALDKPFLSNILSQIFLIVGGAGLMVIGKVFTITKWARDGIQPNESLQLLAVIFGLSGFIIGIFLLFGITLPLQVSGFVGFLALAPAGFILLDYFSKNWGKK